MPTSTPATPTNVTSSDGIDDPPPPLLGWDETIDLTGSDSDDDDEVEDINVGIPRIPPAPGTPRALILRLYVNSNRTQKPKLGRQKLKVERPTTRMTTRMPSVRGLSMVSWATLIRTKITKRK